MGSPVIRARQSAEALLARCVPDGQLEALALEVEELEAEVDACCCFLWFGRIYSRGYIVGVEREKRLWGRGLFFFDVEFLSCNGLFFSIAKPAAAPPVRAFATTLLSGTISTASVSRQRGRASSQEEAENFRRR